MAANEATPLKKSLSERSVIQNKSEMPKTRTKILQNRDLESLHGEQKLLREGFSTRWAVFDTLMGLAPKEGESLPLLIPRNSAAMREHGEGPALLDSSGPSRRFLGDGRVRRLDRWT